MVARRKLNLTDKPLQSKGLRKLPHSVLFTVVNLAYCVPVVLAYILGFGEGGVAQTLDIDSAEVFRFSLVYLLAITSFHLGAWLVWKFPFNVGAISNKAAYAESVNPTGFKIVLSIVCACLILTKILLIPLGVYQNYVFDADTPDGGIWSISMFFSESLIVLLLAILIATRSLKSPWFLLGFACLATNLLHGTRIFVTATTLGVIVYFWLTRKVNFRLLAYGVIAVIVLVAALYLAFVSRTDYQYSDEATGLTVAISPIVYEAVFSQMSLFGYLHAYTPDLFGQPLGFLADAISFLTPRFINPDKGLGTVLQPYFNLNPLGAFAGHAAGLIYFGYSLLIFYFLLGAFGSWLQRQARIKPVFFILYLYFISDILFRLMRDGFILPVKYFVDGAVIVLIAVAISAPRKRRRRAPPQFAQPALD